MTVCLKDSTRRHGHAFAFCALAVVFLILVAPARAGVLDSWQGSRENANLIGKLLRERIVEPGLDILRRSTDGDGESLLRETDNFFATAKRKVDETAGRVIANHLKAAADRMGFGKAAALGASIREKVVDKAVEKVAGFVTDKAWSAAETAADRLASRQEQEGSAAAVSRTGRDAERAWDGALAEAGTRDGDEPSAAAGAVDPLIALDIHEDEQEWYRTETDVLDGRPLPEVDVPAAAGREDGGGHSFAVAEDRGGEADGDCEDVWSGCPGEEYWNRELQEKARRIDPWADYRQSADAAPNDGEAGKAVEDLTRSGDAWGCEDDWGRCPETGFAGGNEVRTDDGGSVRTDDAGYRDGSSGGGYAAVLAKSTDGTAAPSSYGERTSEGGYQATLDRIEKEEADRRRREEEARLMREGEEAERASRQAAASAGSRSESADSGGSSSDGISLSSDCEADKVPVCEQAIRTAQMQNAQLQAAVQSTSISGQRALLAQAALNGLNAARTCYSVEPRRHCKDMYQHGMRELERTLSSAQ